MRLVTNLLVLLMLGFGLPAWSGCGSGDDEVAQNSGGSSGGGEHEDEYGDDYGGDQYGDDEYSDDSGEDYGEDYGEDEGQEGGEEGDGGSRRKGRGGGNRTASPEHSAGSPEHSAGSSEHSAGSSEHSAGSSEHSAGSSEHSAGSSEHSAGSSEHSAGSSEHSAGSSEHSADSEHSSESSEDEYGEDYEPESDLEYSDDEEEGYEEEYSGEMEYSDDEEGYGEDYGEEDGYGRRSSEPPAPKTLLDRSNLAFAQGDDEQAFQYLFAHAITADKPAATELLNKMGWVSIPSDKSEEILYANPTLGIRWAIGIDFTPIKNYSGSSFPVGENQSKLTSGARGGYGGDEGYEEGYGDEGDGGGYGGGRSRGGSTGGIPDSVDRLTGELGQRVLSQLRERITRGHFGKVLADAVASTAAAGNSRNRSSYGSGYGSGYGDEYGEEDYGEDYGQDYNSGYGSGGNAGRRAPGLDGDSTLESIAPGVTMIGVADERELRKRAKDIHADVLILFEVELKPIVARQLVSNDTRVYVYDMVLDDDVYKTKPINNIQVQNARAGVKGFEDKDNVEKEVEALFEFIDDKWWLSEIPSMLQPEHIIARLQTLLAEPTENPLPVAAEIRMWNTRELLQDDHLASAYGKLLGDPQSGTLLATGTEEQRQQVIQRWLPQGAVAPVTPEGETPAVEPKPEVNPYR